MFYCLVVGSREFTNYKQMEINLNKFLSNQKEVTIVSGCAKGADALAKKYNNPLRIVEFLKKERGMER